MSNSFLYTRATIMRLWWNLIAMVFIGAGTVACWFADRAEGASERADYWDAAMKEFNSDA